MRSRIRLYKKQLLRIGTPLLLIILGNALFSRSASTAEPASAEKTPFFIRTTTIGNSNNTSARIEKRGKIKGSSDITITAQVAWRVQQIPVQVGDKLTNGNLVVRLNDTYGTYEFATKRAWLSVDSAKNTYQQQVENLQKQLEDAQIAYERAKLQSTTAQEDARKQLEKAQFDLDNLSSSAWSSSDLQVQKLEKDLEKAQFDYDTKLKADEQTLTNFINTASNIYTDIVLLMQDVTYETDKILWFTDENRSLNDAYESSLSATNTAYLYTARDVFYALQQQQQKLAENNAASLTIDTVEEQLTEYSAYLQPVNAMLDAMEKVLINTVESANLSQAQIDALKSQFDGYQAKAQGTITSITTQINAITSFLATYEDQQESLAKSVAILKDQITLTKKNLEDSAYTSQVWLDRTQIWADNSTQNALLSLKNAETALDYVRTTKDSTLQSIENSRKQAEVAYAEATTNLEKFSVQTPVDGTVTDIFVDLWQDVTPWTPLFRVVSDQQEIEINLLFSEIPYVRSNQEVTITDEKWTIATGIIVSVSDIWDKNGNFKAIIQVAENTLHVGTFADIVIPVEETIIGIDINAVKIVDNNVGEIFLWDGTEIKKQTVTLWSLLGQQIEIITSLPANTQVVLSNLDAYDPRNMEIQVQQEQQQ